MNSRDIITLGLGLQEPWEIVSQELVTETTPHELCLTIRARRGSRFPCPVCGASCQAHPMCQPSCRLNISEDNHGPLFTRA